MNNKKTVLIVIDYLFGSLRTIKKGDENFLVGIDLMPEISQSLHRLSSSGYEIFLLIRENLTQESYENIKEFIPISVRQVVPFKKNLVDLLDDLIQQFSLSLNSTFFISSNRSLRGLASNRGFTTYPHIKIAAIASENKSLYFTRIISNTNIIERLPSVDIVPYSIEKSNNQYRLLAIISKDVLSQVLSLGSNIDFLNFNLSIDDPVLINLDKKNIEYFDSLTEKYKIIYSTKEELLLAVGPNDNISSIPMHGDHGHFIILFPSLDLLKYGLQDITNTISSFFVKRDPKELDYKTMMILQKWPQDKFEIKPKIKPIEFHALPEEIQPELFKTYLEKYSGETNLDSNGKIQSRHCLHPDNHRIISALKNELEDMGYVTRLENFEATSSPFGTPGIEGTTFSNIIAELTGTGENIEFSPNLPEIIRNIFIKYPLPSSKEGTRELTSLIGEEWFKNNNFDSLTPLELRHQVEKTFELHPWSQWWLKEKEISGINSRIIVIGCHLDSTALNNNNPNYDATRDPAPGADDDASGLAATLCIAKVLSEFRGKLKHTIQFCFFNAEEEGIHGSRAFAHTMKSMDADIVAAICMDMIGYNKDTLNNVFEIHAGAYNNPTIRDHSLEFANLVSQSALNIGKLDRAQIYKGLTRGPFSEIVDRDKFDPAIGRSDHSSFHEKNYPAIVISEDLFGNLSNEDPKDANIHYHSKEDKASELDIGFATNIANAIVHSVKILAEI